MEASSPSDVIANLRRLTLRTRVGLWLAPSTYLGYEDDEAARLGIDQEDLRQALLAILPSNTHFTGLDASKMIALLDDICQQAGHSDCVLVYNVDLLLAGLSYADRAEVWRFMWSGFPHRPRSLLLLMPDTACDLLPRRSALEHWSNEGRLAGKAASYSI